MITFRISWLILAFLVAWNRIGPAAPPPAVAPPWTTREGLPQNSVFAVTQTRDGYLWLGTGGGLARFDGLRFKTFDESNTPLLGSAKAVKLFEDSRGNLWIATDTAGLFFSGPGRRISR